MIGRRAGHYYLFIAKFAKVILCSSHIFLFRESYLILEYDLVVILVVNRNEQVVGVVALVDRTNLRIHFGGHLCRRLRYLLVFTATFPFFNNSALLFLCVLKNRRRHVVNLGFRLVLYC